MASLSFRFLFSIMTCILLTVTHGQYENCRNDEDCAKDQCCAISDLGKGFVCKGKGDPGDECQPDGYQRTQFCPCKLKNTCKEPNSQMPLSGMFATCSDPNSPVGSLL